MSFSRGKCFIKMELEQRFALRKREFYVSDITLSFLNLNFKLYSINPFRNIKSFPHSKTSLMQPPNPHVN